MVKKVVLVVAKVPVKTSENQENKTSLTTENASSLKSSSITWQPVEVIKYSDTNSDESPQRYQRKKMIGLCFHVFFDCVFSCVFLKLANFFVIL